MNEQPDNPRKVTTRPCTKCEGGTIKQGIMACMACLNTGTERVNKDGNRASGDRKAIYPCPVCESSGLMDGRSWCTNCERTGLTRADNQGNPCKHDWSNITPDRYRNSRYMDLLCRKCKYSKSFV
jgi:RecJ-like exonuclease